MGSNLYSCIAAAAFIVNIFLFRCSQVITKNSNDGKAFRGLLAVIMSLNICDIFWGLADAKTLHVNIGVYDDLILIYFFLVSACSFGWYIFMKWFLRSKANRVAHFLELLPFTAEIVLLILQRTNNVIYSVGADQAYTPGPCRIWMFILSLAYFVLGIVRTIICILKKEKLEDHQLTLTAFQSQIVLIISVLLQFFFPMAPYYSIGFMVAAIVMFNGSFVIAHEKALSQLSEYHQKESKEILTALTTLSNMFESINLIDLQLRRQHVIRDSQNIKDEVDESLDIKDQINGVYNNLCLPEWKKTILDFVNLDTICDRLMDKDIISQEYESALHNWYVINFLVDERDENGVPVKIIHAVTNITVQRRNEKEFRDAITLAQEKQELLRTLAETDPLTGLRNRRSGEATIAMMFETREEGLFCILDIDEFKSINDTYGHQVGDKALIATAKAIRESFRENDVTMRIGGDEFGIYAKDIVTEKMAAEKIRSFFRRIEDISIPEMGDRKITISLGATFIDASQNRDFDDFYRLADKSMYECKGLPGSNFRIF